MIVSTDMAQAPRDRHILILTKTYAYWDGWHESGMKWLECRWYEAGNRYGAFTGSASQSTERIEPLAWTEVPPIPDEYLII